VGAGTSGAVFASRLTEDEGRSVLLLEAGGDPFDDQNVNIPILADSVRGTEFDWNYRTVPQKHACLGHVNNVRTVATPCVKRGFPTDPQRKRDLGVEPSAKTCNCKLLLPLGECKRAIPLFPKFIWTCYY